MLCTNTRHCQGLCTSHRIASHRIRITEITYLPLFALQILFEIVLIVPTILLNTKDALNTHARIHSQFSILNSHRKRFDFYSLFAFHLFACSLTRSSVGLFIHSFCRAKFLSWGIRLCCELSCSLVDFLHWAFDAVLCFLVAVEHSGGWSVAVFFPSLHV